MTWGDFFAMGGYGFFVWISYGLTAGAMLFEVLLLLKRRNALLAPLPGAPASDFGPGNSR